MFRYAGRPLLDKSRNRPTSSSCFARLALKEVETINVEKSQLQIQKQPLKLRFEIPDC